MDQTPSKKKGLPGRDTKPVAVPDAANLADAAKPAAVPDAAPRAAAQPAAPPVRAPIGAARARPRHWLVLLSFLLMVVAPAGATGWYLWTRAVDQYASYVGFSVRKEEGGGAVELLGGITELSGSMSMDTDILFEFLQSQELVAAIDAELDLRTIWSRADPALDPIFAYHPPGTIEDLVDHWARKVKVSYDSGTALLNVRVLAFRPEDATAIATLIFDEEQRDDQRTLGPGPRGRHPPRPRGSRAGRGPAEGGAPAAAGLPQPHPDHRPDPAYPDPVGPDRRPRRAQLAEARIELELLRDTAQTNDPRLTQAQRRIEVIQQQITDELSKLGLDGAETSSVADLVGEYEALAVDLQFAQGTYTAALAAFDAARYEARRQSRYLAAHVQPTRAEAARFPDRSALMGLTVLFLFLFWAMTVLVGYALRDRR